MDTSEHRFCGSCGHEIEGRFGRFCTVCGEELQGEHGDAREPAAVAGATLSAQFDGPIEARRGAGAKGAAPTRPPLIFPPPVMPGRRGDTAPPFAPDGIATNGHPSPASATAPVSASAASGAAVPLTSGAAADSANGRPEEAPPTRVRRFPRPARIAAIVAVVALLAVVGVVAALVLTQSKPAPKKPSYASLAAHIVSPVVADNRSVTNAITALHLGTNTSSAKAAVTQASQDALTARAQLATLDPKPAEEVVAGQLAGALGAEALYLSAVAGALRSQNAASSGNLVALGSQLQSKFAVLDGVLPGGDAAVGGYVHLGNWVNKVVGAQQGKAAITSFVGQVETLLTQSTPSFDEINQVFGQMNIAAQGGTADISLAQAEASIGDVISNRTSLEAAAAALHAPSGVSAQVAGALTSAFQASLVADRAIQDCLNEANSGVVAIVFASCLSSTALDSNTATVDKQQFTALYNKLRSEVGQPAASVAF